MSKKEEDEKNVIANYIQYFIKYYISINEEIIHCR